MEFKTALNHVIEKHPRVQKDLSRRETIKKVVEDKLALVSANGSLVTWTLPDSTGRSPQDTLIVHRPETDDNIDWDSPNNLRIDPTTFEMLWKDALKVLEHKKQIYITQRVIGADSAYALPVQTVTDSSLTDLFTLNMFRPIPEDIGKSVFTDTGPA